MSERDFWDEESFQKYKAELIQKRNSLNPTTQKLQIKICDNMIKDLPNHYLESQVDFKKSKQVHKDNSTKKDKPKIKTKKVKSGEVKKTTFFKDIDWGEALPILYYLLRIYVLYEVIGLIYSADKNIFFKVIISILIVCIEFQWFVSKVNKKE